MPFFVVEGQRGLGMPDDGVSLGLGQMLSLIELVYATVQEPALWTKVMEKIADVVGGGETVTIGGGAAGIGGGGLAVMEGGVATAFWSAPRVAEEPVYAMLRPHIQRAFEMQMQMGDLRAQVQGMKEALNLFGHAVFGVDAAGRVVVANRRAEELAAQGDGVSVAGGRLRCGWEPVAGSALVGRKGREPLRVTAVPFRAEGEGSARKMAGLVVVSDPESGVGTRGAALKALYGVTPTEVRVADLLLRGLEVKEAAEALGMTVETARFHTKRLLGKTGTRRQAEMMRLMLSLPQG